LLHGLTYATEYSSNRKDLFLFPTIMPDLTRTQPSIGNHARCCTTLID